MIITGLVDFYSTILRQCNILKLQCLAWWSPLCRPQTRLYHSDQCDTGRGEDTGFLTELTVTKWNRFLLNNLIRNILNFLIVAADNLTHILHGCVRHFYFISVFDTSQDAVFRKVVNDLEKFFSNISFNVAGEGWIEPHDFSCSGSVFPQALALALSLLLQSW